MRGTVCTVGLSGWRRLGAARWLWGWAALLPLVVWLRTTDTGPHDLDVYRAGARVLLHLAPGSLYHLGIPRMSYTYPPATTVLFVPLAVLSPAAATHLTRALLCGAVAGLVSLSLRAAAIRTTWWQYLLLTWACALTAPVLIDLRQGQVSLPLVLMLVADLGLGVRGRHRGWLTGLAAGIKLTPLVLLGFLALTRQWAALARATAAFAATVVVGFMILPSSSRLYWTHDVFATKRVGTPWNAADLSLRAAAYRIGALDTPTGRALLDVSIAVTALAAYAVSLMLWRRGEPLLAVAVASLVGLYASPVSWIHHWCWAVPLVIGLFRISRVLAAAALVVFLASQRLLLLLGWAHTTHTWGLVQDLLGDAYLWLSLLLLVALALRCRGIGVSGPESARTTPAAHV